jgi:hypothetical protein
VDTITIYSNSAANNKIHELACSTSSGGKQRRIEILTSATEISKYVHFRGTQSLHWLEGWMAMCDDNRKWNIEKVTGQDQDSECTFA